MSQRLEVRDSRRDDSAAIESLYREAFPNENLLPLVRDLLKDTVVALSLVGVINARIVGHATFTRCVVTGNSTDVALLGPLAVAPKWQRQGIGSAIVRAGLQQLQDADVNWVYVLGDPAYYARFGFQPESSVEPPYPLPAEWNGAWQSLHLGEQTTPCTGKLSVPPPWRQPGLWAP